MKYAFYKKLKNSPDIPNNWVQQGENFPAREGAYLEFFRVLLLHHTHNINHLKITEDFLFNRFTSFENMDYKWVEVYEANPIPAPIQGVPGFPFL